MFSAIPSLSLNTSSLALASVTNLSAYNVSFVQSFLDDALQTESVEEVDPYLRSVGPALEEIGEHSLADSANQLLNAAPQTEVDEGETPLDLIHEFFSIVREGDSVTHEISYVEALADNDDALAILRDIELEGEDAFAARARELEFLLEQPHLARTQDTATINAARLIMGFRPTLPSLLDLDASLSSLSIDLLSDVDAIHSQYEAALAITMRLQSALVFLGQISDEIDPFEAKLQAAFNVADPLRELALTLFQETMGAPQSRISIDDEIVPSSPDIKLLDDESEEIPLPLDLPRNSMTLGDVVGSELQRLGAVVPADDGGDPEVTAAAQLADLLTESLEIFIQTLRGAH